ncbi:MAG: ABC transporter, permease protein 1 (cluster 1, maltose/g3p/polyamine/iron) [uncultured Thermomicrobiales bacterium]|uniref:ABC transporter, permease protein 1 (Cluster 1, maltose/g3p/polyamine/iron) n=1 Tax=uncultured Thermomicrobiales bacterium TaxID=1645740 RepID=A0A6J4U382_9BACT|nr:MAG: ABC transporter, permease protein 1 (cluster 1, maltose/g3p/polyamine/iron) [uncultured Thermomicrobiales bacterium]
MGTERRRISDHDLGPRGGVPGLRVERRPGARAAARSRLHPRALWRARWPLLFISPFFVLFAVFGIYPILFSLWLSLHEWRGIGPMRWVGLENYRFLFGDGIFWGSMRNSLILFLIYVPVMTLLAIVLASLLHAGFLRLQGIWRALIFLPHITSMVATGYTFRLLLETRSGFVNQALGVVGIGQVAWLDDRWWARISLGLLMIWAWLGYNTVIMLAGLQTIPTEIAEAARVDGATQAQVFRQITVPLLRPVIIFSVTLSIIGTFQMYTEPLVLTGGGPVRATETPVMQIFQTTFANLRFGYAAAMSYVYFAVIVVITLLQFRFVSREDAG